HRGQEILGIHAGDLRRNLLAAAKARQREGYSSIPAPAHLEHRCGAERLHEHLPGRLRIQISGHFRELEAMRVSERQDDLIFRSRRLQLEIESAAKALAKRE